MKCLNIQAYSNTTVCKCDFFHFCIINSADDFLHAYIKVFRQTFYRSISQNCLHTWFMLYTGPLTYTMAVSMSDIIFWIVTAQQLSYFTPILIMSHQIAQGTAVQSIISLMSSLVVKMLTVLVSTISNSQVFLLFSAKISVYAIFNDQSFNDMLTNHILSFEKLQCRPR